MTWLSEELKQKVRKVFEPRYKRVLTDDEVMEIAENLTGVMEGFLRLRWKGNYGKPNAKL